VERADWLRGRWLADSRHRVGVDPRGRRHQARDVARDPRRRGTPRRGGQGPDGKLLAARRRHRRDAAHVGAPGGGDAGRRPGRTSEENAVIKWLQREDAELRADEILKAASAYFARELDPRLPR